MSVKRCYYCGKMNIFRLSVNNETNIMTIEKLQTIWSGLCYKMTYRNFSLDKPNFLLKFDTSLASEDIPLAEIYLTSEDNAYGILGNSWNNGITSH